jgi:ribonuclease T1
LCRVEVSPYDFTMIVRSEFPPTRGVLPHRTKAAGAARLLCLMAIVAFGAFARTTPDTLPEVALADLPKEARNVYVLVGKGGPFPFDRDGIVFGNREKLLPAKPPGYYHEYTVRTPGVKSRGGRRLICGGTKETPDACFYTEDHYRSFRKIRT